MKATTIVLVTAIAIAAVLAVPAALSEVGIEASLIDLAPSAQAAGACVSTYGNPGPSAVRCVEITQPGDDDP